MKTYETKLPNSNIFSVETEEIDKDNEAENTTNHPILKPNLHTSAARSPVESRDKQEKSPSKIRPNLPGIDVLPSCIRKRKWENFNYEHLCNNINEYL